MRDRSLGVIMDEISLPDVLLTDPSTYSLLVPWNLEETGWGNCSFRPFSCFLLLDRNNALSKRQYSGIRIRWCSFAHLLLLLLREYGISKGHGMKGRQAMQL
jgi:hypothetical protein